MNRITQGYLIYGSNVIYYNNVRILISNIMIELYESKYGKKESRLIVRITTIKTQILDGLFFYFQLNHKLVLYRYE